MKKTTILAGIFSDGMVLQRNAENRIWGSDALANEVTIQLDEYKCMAKVISGKFSALLPAREAGTGYTIIVKGSETVEIHDVRFGDVFMLSGQSNMELPVERVLDVSADEVGQADYPDICQYRLNPDFVFGDNEESSLPVSKWTRAIPGEIMEMSAAGFFFAERIHEKLGVPIGLILNAQGGSSIEAWMPLTVLNAFGDYSGEIKPFLQKGALDLFLKEREIRIGKWYESIDNGVKETYCREIPSGANRMMIPAMFEGKAGGGFSGCMWFYKEIFLENDPGDSGFLYAGELIDSDRTYINGILIGQTAYRYPPRKYDFDASVLHTGKNLIAIRLVIENGCGGFISEHPYYLESGDQHIDLDGEWSYIIEKEALYPSEEGFMAQKLPTGLFRAAIMPLQGIAFKGVLWYQGETNSGNPERYDEKFSTMMDCWRKYLAQDLPVICVEMADYKDPITGESEGWSEIQRLQRKAPEVTELCEVVSAKDLGAPYELHPQYKSELGRRLAEKAMDFLYYR